MKVLLIAIGSRGDVEPFLAVGEALEKRGFSVVCCFPVQFEQLALDSNMKFRGLSPKFLELLDTNEGKIAMGSKASFIQKMKAYYSLYKQMSVINEILFEQQAKVIEEENPDKIIYHIKAIYPLIWGLKHPNKTIILSPIPYMLHTVYEYSHIGFKFNFGKKINGWTYSLANYGLIKNVQSIAKKMLDYPLSDKQLKQALKNTYTVYSISKTLYKSPSYWAKNIEVIGYQERDKTLNWEADNSLKLFIAKHPKILFITFGSMVNTTPKEKTALFLNILKEHKITAIINTSSGGLVEPDDYDKEQFYFVSNIPYDWIFSRVYAVVHHGGAGTTHTALKYACPALIIPHIVDQYLWNNLNFEKGAGPKGIAISKITNSNLAPKILDLMINPRYKKNALKIASQMARESEPFAFYKKIESL